ncbi:hypothetical protein [Paenibacillus caui]|uniref:hypothetical protein n=1 Tax=Paenibacillus caui TaxID=2873927 RepID=UPI001CA7E19E|nr:hypothetical protein [Paenibacillus caui]
MIDVSKPLAYDEGFPRVPNIMYRMYPLLDGFTVETAGFYGYLRSWRQSNKDHAMFGKTWLNQQEMAVQSGLSPHKIRKHVKTLEMYGLLRVTKILPSTEQENIRVPGADDRSGVPRPISGGGCRVWAVIIRD